jgi:hypothetical protein
MADSSIKSSVPSPGSTPPVRAGPFPFVLLESIKVFMGDGYVETWISLEEAHRVLEQLLQLIVAELWDPGQLSLQTGLRVLEADQVEEQPAKTAPPVLEGLAPT